MSYELPKYNLEAFCRHEPDPVFYCTRLEKLVHDFKGIDRPHSHTFYLLMWIKKGHGQHTIDFKSYTVNENQLYFLTPGQVHSWELSDDLEGFNLYFEQQFFQRRFGNRLYQYPFFHSHQHTPVLQIAEDAALLNDLFRYANLEYEQRKSSNTELLLSFVHIILETANKRYTDLIPIHNKHYYDKFREFEELIEKQFLFVREINAYAAQLHITPNHLNHICKQISNKTASQLFQERLIIEAQRLLIHTARSVKEICFLLGFEDPSYFVRFFKKRVGLTPEGFRNR